MSKTEKNKTIVAEIRQRLQSLGIGHLLDVYPVENPCTRRPRFWTDGNGSALFKVHLWDLNDLAKDSLSKEIDQRISEARNHFGI